MSPILAPLVGIAIVVRLLQDWKAEAPMLVMLLGNVIPVRPAPANALLPMLVTLLGNAILVRLRHR